MEQMSKTLEKQIQKHIKAAKDYFQSGYFLFAAIECHYVIEKSLKKVILDINRCLPPMTQKLPELGEFLKAPEYVMSALRYINMSDYILPGPGAPGSCLRNIDRWRMLWIFDSVNLITRWLSLYAGLDAESSEIFKTNNPA